MTHPHPNKPILRHFAEYVVPMLVKNRKVVGKCILGGAHHDQRVSDHFLVMFAGLVVGIIATHMIVVSTAENRGRYGILAGDVAVRPLGTKSKAATFSQVWM